MIPLTKRHVWWRGGDGWRLQILRMGFIMVNFESHKEKLKLCIQPKDGSNSVWKSKLSGSVLPLAEISCEYPVAPVKIHGRTYFLRIFSVSIRRESSAALSRKGMANRSSSPRFGWSLDGPARVWTSRWSVRNPSVGNLKPPRNSMRKSEVLDYFRNWLNSIWTWGL